MTWPPPPPSSDPWATGAVPGRDDGESAAEPALEPLEPGPAGRGFGSDELPTVEQPIDQPYVLDPPAGGRRWLALRRIRHAAAGGLG